MIEPKRVRFDDIPVIIEPEVKLDDYDIIQDIKDKKANITIGQLLHDNVNYQKLIREEWTKKRKWRLKLPFVAVNFAEVEDYGALEIVVEVDGCTIPKVPVDGGSSVNLMLEDTAFDLGYTSFKETNQILRVVKSYSSGTIFSSTNPDWRGNLPSKFRHHSAKNRKAFSHVTWKTPAIFCKGSSGLGS